MIDKFEFLVAISPNNVGDGERPEKWNQSWKERGEYQCDLLRDGVQVDGHTEFEIQMQLYFRSVMICVTIWGITGWGWIAMTLFQTWRESVFSSWWCVVCRVIRFFECHVQIRDTNFQYIYLSKWIHSLVTRNKEIDWPNTHVIWEVWHTTGTPVQSVKTWCYVN